MSDSIRNILYMGHNIALLEALFDPADKSGEYGSVTHLINSENLYSTLAEKNYNQLISEIPLNNDLIAKITRDFPFLKTTYLMPPDASKSIDYYQENALSDKERLMLRAAADLSTDLVYFKDLESRFLSCNKNFEKFMGCPEQEIVGKTD
ncbi:MAG: GGDEF domain-containing protein, partial [Psychromonas sp.]